MVTKFNSSWINLSIPSAQLCHQCRAFHFAAVHAYRMPRTARESRTCSIHAFDLRVQPWASLARAKRREMYFYIPLAGRHCRASRSATARHSGIPGISSLSTKLRASSTWSPSLVFDDSSRHMGYVDDLSHRFALTPHGEVLCDARS